MSSTAKANGHVLMRSDGAILREGTEARLNLFTKPHSFRELVLQLSHSLPYPLTPHYHFENPDVKSSKASMAADKDNGTPRVFLARHGLFCNSTDGYRPY